MSFERGPPPAAGAPGALAADPVPEAPRRGGAGSIPGRFLNSLSGRLLILTMIFVMLAEVLIFVPSVARFRHDYLLQCLEKSQIASLALLADDTLEHDLETELLMYTGVYTISMRRDLARELVLSSPIPTPIARVVDLRDPSGLELIRDAMVRLLMMEDETIRVIGEPVMGGGIVIEVTMGTAPMRAAMLDYGLRILILSAAISIFTAGLLFLAVRGFLVKPIRGVARAMSAYAAAPEDARTIIVPSAGATELREAETALMSMQTQLTGTLRQKERLAQLGGAVAKISHDLRNMLTVAQLFSDRLDVSEDPAVRRTAPKLVGSVTRAMNLCEATLAFGKAEEPPPRLRRVALGQVVADAVEAERLGAEAEARDVVIETDVPANMQVRADPEQLYRVIGNLVRNARQAIVASGKPGRVSISASESESEWILRISDDGPGLPAKAREHLFLPFQGGARKGGAGLGLAIAVELVRGHGGRLDLVGSGEDGTCFAVRLPKSAVGLDGNGGGADCAARDAAPVLPGGA